MPFHRATRSIGRRAAFLALAYVALTAALLSAMLLQLRSESLDASKRALTAFAQLAASHTAEVVFTMEDALKVVEATLSVATDASMADEESIDAMLRGVASSARGLQDVYVLNARGRVVYQAAGHADIGVDRSDWPTFAQYRDNAGSTFDIGRPIHRQPDAAGGDWIVPISHAWRRANGDFAGVIVGVMDPQFFEKAWAFDSGIAGLSIALTSANGTVIMSRPFLAVAMGAPLTADARVSALPADATSGTLDVRRAFDGEDLLVAYRRVGAYSGLLTFVAQPVDIVLADWWLLVKIVGVIWLVGSAALGGLGLWLAREMTARSALQGRYQVLFDSLPYPVIVSDPATGRLLAFNAEAGRQYGWPEATATSRLPDQFASLSNQVTNLSTQSAVLIGDLQHRTGDGRTVDVEMNARLMEYDGRPVVLAVVIDVTKRLQMERARRADEEQLRQSRKMDVLGQLTGGIAHDFSNALTVIMENVEALVEGGKLDPQSQKKLDRIADSAQRADNLTRQMLAFSRKAPLHPRPTIINDLVVDIGKMLRRTLGAQIEIDSILAEDLWTVDVDKSHLETVLTNLCLNARDSMPTGGRLLIETRNVTLTRDEGATLADGAPGDYVLLAVSDTGFGIPPGDLDKVFEPFFAAGDGRKGLGLGLSTVYGFVKQSGGRIEIESDIDRGTTFKLYLPRVARAAEPTGVSRRSTAVGGSESILVVEDDADVRANVVGQLSSLGYAVSQAADGLAGLAAFQASKPYDLLLTDVVMPGPMNGKALADEVLRRWPETKVVFMSGYTDNALSRGDHLETVRLLSKPFRKSDLALIIRQALDSEPVAVEA